MRTDQPQKFKQNRKYICGPEAPAINAESDPRTAMNEPAKPEAGRMLR